MPNRSLTLLYEIDMLRHCKRTSNGKRKAHDERPSEETRAEFCLCIEGFLLHMRNLLGFFTNQGTWVSDLIINRPDRWAIEDVDLADCQGLINSAEVVNKKYGEHGKDCYKNISQHMQHCTTFRGPGAKSWNIDGMFADLDPILQEFGERFGRILAEARDTENPGPKAKEGFSLVDTDSPSHPKRLF